jgi:AcrR family transcriptional regulator
MSQKYDRLVRTAEILFVKHGMARITVEEICQQAGVSKPTFYKYFKNKDALARKIDEMWIDEALQQIKTIEQAKIPFPEKMKRILAVKQDLSARPGTEFLEDLINLNIDLGDAFKQVLAFFIRSQQAGDIRHDLQPEFLISAFTALNNMQYDPRIRALYRDAEALSQDVFKLFYYGALSAHHRQAGPTENDVKPLPQARPDENHLNG